MPRGFKLAKPGFNVLTCEDKDLIMSYEFSSLKVAYQDETTGGTSYTHGLGYAPAYFVTVGNNFLGQNATSPFEVTYYSTDTIFYYGGAGVKYYLFYQDV